MDVTVQDQAPRAGTIQAQITNEVLQSVVTALNETKDDDGKPRPGKVVAIGGQQQKEGTARTIVEAVMKRLEALDPPIYVRTHIRAVKDGEGKDAPVIGYRGSVSLTPDGKPSRKKHKDADANGAAPAPAAPAAGKTTDKNK